MLSVRTLVAEATQALFNIENKLWKTLHLLFRRPSELTRAYLAGQRVRYVSPLRLYFISSVLYFALAALMGSTDVMFISFNWEGQPIEDLSEFLPRLMFVVIPAYAALLMGVYWRPKRLYVEHLIVALHIHAIWFFLFSISVVLDPWTNQLVEDGIYNVITLVATLLSVVVQLAMFVYEYRILRSVYGASAWRTIGKLIVLYIGYILVVTACVVTYAFVMARLQG